jgi:hypothetical protein
VVQIDAPIKSDAGGFDFQLERVNLQGAEIETGADYNSINPGGYVSALQLDRHNKENAAPARAFNFSRWRALLLHGLGPARHLGAASRLSGTVAGHSARTVAHPAAPSLFETWFFSRSPTGSASPM